MQATVAMMQASGQQVLQTVDSPDGPSYRIEVPRGERPRRPAPCGTSVGREVLIDAQGLPDHGVLGARHVPQAALQHVVSVDHPLDRRIGAAGSRLRCPRSLARSSSPGTARRAPRRTSSSPRFASWRARKAFGDLPRRSAPTVSRSTTDRSSRSRTCRSRSSAGRFTAFSARMARERPRRSGCCWISLRPARGNGRDARRRLPPVEPRGAQAGRLSPGRAADLPGPERRQAISTTCARWTAARSPDGHLAAPARSGST